VCRRGDENCGLGFDDIGALRLTFQIFQAMSWFK
jgi:hypothetical protein